MNVSGGFKSAKEWKSTTEAVENNNFGTGPVTLTRSAPAVNHAKVAAEAIRFRISTIRRPLVDSETIDVEAMGAASVTAGNPEVDAALRRIATEWQRAGLDWEALGRPWGAEAMELFKDRKDIIDDIDVIVRAAGTAAGRSISAA